jgi:hypothetical protein
MLTVQIKTENFSGGKVVRVKKAGICLSLPYLFVSALICCWVCKHSDTSSVTHVFYFLRISFLNFIFNYRSDVIICLLKTQISNFYLILFCIFILYRSSTTVTSAYRLYVRHHTE